MSYFGGSAWTWDRGRGQFYLHTFLAEQPDLNWREPAVRAAQLAMIRGWLDHGVDGFRLDVFNVFYKHARAGLEPAPPAGRRPGSPGFAAGTASTTSTTRTNPTCSSSWPSSGRWSMPAPGG